MTELENILIQDWKEQRKTDVEVLQAYEDIVQDGNVSLDLDKINYELKRYNLLHSLTSKRKINKIKREEEKREINKLMIRVERITKEGIEERERNPAIKIKKIYHQKYLRNFMGGELCPSCNSVLNEVDVKQEEIIKDKTLKGISKKEHSRLLLLTYCPFCKEVYYSKNEVEMHNYQLPMIINWIEDHFYRG